MLQPLIDPTFSEHSHGFRPGRRARDAVLAAQQYVQEGFRVVVDGDLSKFFDRVIHDILIDRLRKRVSDAGIIRLVRAYLNAGIMDNGVVLERVDGTPQAVRSLRYWLMCYSTRWIVSWNGEAIASLAMPTTAMCMCAVGKLTNG